MLPRTVINLLSSTAAAAAAAAVAAAVVYLCFCMCVRKKKPRLQELRAQFPLSLITADKSVFKTMQIFALIISILGLTCSAWAGGWVGWPDGGWLKVCVSLNCDADSVAPSESNGGCHAKL